MISIIDDFRAVLGSAEHQHHAKAVKFLKHTRELYSSASGQEWLQTLILFAGHPMLHPPLADQALSAHIHGRCEVTAFLFRCGSEETIPIIDGKKPKTKTEPTNQPEHHGKHKQRRTRSPKGRSTD